ncbi:hypothetical protein HMPREF9103_02269 [Lentilactobacillus parafarraginis F0439]|uniref:Uncharacterized protein n=1 Tax=Lentilactobacillus parafarraginis F0439 TaxID=797515 RepID=G9ZRA8_9LACO|nr:hypothetical protein HMPREF9103_02269 [Lentilactobacillus parafarraginis F0439]
MTSKPSANRLAFFSKMIIAFLSLLLYRGNKLLQDNNLLLCYENIFLLRHHDHW